MKSVSVVMSTLNGSSYVVSQLESVRNQTFQPAELVISDNGSSDNTLKIAARFAETVRFTVRICCNDERNPALDSFVHSLILCSGDLVAFLSPRERWHPDKLARCVAAFDHPEVVMAAHTATIVDEDGRYGGFVTQGISGTDFLPPLSGAPWGAFLPGTMVVRRELLSWMKVGDFLAGGEQAGDLRSVERALYMLAHGLGVTATISQPLSTMASSPYKAPGFLRRLMTGTRRLSASAAAGRLRGLEARASRTSDLMVELALAKPSRLRVRHARAAAVYWKRAATICALRASLHEAPTFTRRRAALERLVALGLYVDGDGLAGRLLVRDALSGLLQLPAPAPLVPDLDGGGEARQPTRAMLS